MQFWSPLCSPAISRPRKTRMIPARQDHGKGLLRRRRSQPITRSFTRNVPGSLEHGLCVTMRRMVAPWRHIGFQSSVFSTKFMGEKAEFRLAFVRDLQAFLSKFLRTGCYTIPSSRSLCDRGPISSKGKSPTELFQGQFLHFPRNCIEPFVRRAFHSSSAQFLLIVELFFELFQRVVSVSFAAIFASIVGISSTFPPFVLQASVKD